MGYEEMLKNSPIAAAMIVQAILFFKHMKDENKAEREQQERIRSMESEEKKALNSIIEANTSAIRDLHASLVPVLGRWEALQVEIAQIAAQVRMDNRVRE